MIKTLREKGLELTQRFYDRLLPIDYSPEETEFLIEPPISWKDWNNNDVLKQTGGHTLDEAQNVIANGHPPMADKLILLDFDGVCAPFGYLFSYPPPLNGVAVFTQMMKRKGFRIGIFTSRLNKEWLKSVNQTAEQHIEYITKYNTLCQIKFDFITSDKYPARQIFDDTATNVHNNWDEIIEQWKDA